MMFSLPVILSRIPVNLSITQDHILVRENERLPVELKKVDKMIGRKTKEVIIPAQKNIQNILNRSMIYFITPSQRPRA